MPVKKVTVDSRNHDGLFGDNTSYFAGYYLVNDEKFNDEGNTDRGDAQSLPVAMKVLELLEIEDEDEEFCMDLMTMMQDKLPYDYEQGVLEITGTSMEDLKVNLV